MRVERELKRVKKDNEYSDRRFEKISSFSASSESLYSSPCWFGWAYLRLLGGSLAAAAEGLALRRACILLSLGFFVCCFEFFLFPFDFRRIVGPTSAHLAHFVDFFHPYERSFFKRLWQILPQEDKLHRKSR